MTIIELFNLMEFGLIWAIRQYGIWSMDRKVLFSFWASMNMFAMMLLYILFTKSEAGFFDRFQD